MPNLTKPDCGWSPEVAEALANKTVTMTPEDFAEEISLAGITNINIEIPATQDADIDAAGFTDYVEGKIYRIIAVSKDNDAHMIYPPSGTYLYEKPLVSVECTPDTTTATVYNASPAKDDTTVYEFFFIGDICYWTCKVFAAA